MCTGATPVFVGGDRAVLSTFPSAVPAVPPLSQSLFGAGPEAASLFTGGEGGSGHSPARAVGLEVALQRERLCSGNQSGPENLGSPLQWPGKEDVVEHWLRQP